MIGRMAAKTFSPFERKRRLAARIALYSSAAVTATVAFSLVSVLGRPLVSGESVTWVGRQLDERPEVKELQEYVRIDTSAVTGDEVAGAKFLAELLRRGGVEPHLELAAPKHANVWAIVEGEDPRAVVLHNHIDVEGIAPEEVWFSPPFEARIEMPWMYGRGTFDMKSIALAQLHAFLGIAQSGKKPKRSVIFLATADEETGSKFGVRWMLAQHPELRDRFETVLTEGGFVEARTLEDIKYWGTEFCQKRFSDLYVRAPERAPLERLRDEIKSRIDHQNNLRVVPEVRAYLSSYSTTRDDPRIVDSLHDLDGLIQDSERFAKLPGYVKSMFRDEAVPFALGELPAGQGFQLTIKFHLLPGTELSAVQEQILPAKLLAGFEVTSEDVPTALHGSPIENPDLQKIFAVLKREHPKAIVGPALLPWTATDARFFRASGIPTYGFSPFVIMNTDTLQVDSANERMSVPGFVGGVELYRRLLDALVL